MTTISCGGGPTLGQRRAFAGLKEGAQIPGYGGYCPQLKYRLGNTYGQETHLLAKDREFYVHRAPNEDFSAVRATYHPDVTKPQYKFILKHPLPLSTGDNRYTKEMVPGFTGYVPSMPFRYGATYRELCDQAIDDMMTNQDTLDREDSSLQQTTAMYTKAQPISRDPRVKELLNQYRDTHPLRPTLVDDHRALTEAPMPGYRGFIPRVGVSEIGLGSRYHKASERGLDNFYRTMAVQEDSVLKPVDIKHTVTGTTNAIDVRKQPMSAFTGRRLYAKGGMVPKYTGYIPHRRYAYGNTYGETTRKLSVCHHDDPTYGDHLRRTQTSSAYF